MSYEEAQQLLQQAPEDNKGSLDAGKEILYTGVIVRELDHFQDSRELLQYFAANAEQFGYNNATAYHYIHKLWKLISKEDGLAMQERLYLLSPEKASPSANSIRNLCPTIASWRN